MPRDLTRAGDKYPIMRTDDLAGAIWLPGDGKANRADLCMSLAKGTRNRGVKMVEGVEVTGVLSVMGPQAREPLARVSPDDLSPVGLKFSWTKEIDLGLHEAGKGLALKDADYYALDAQRIEQGRRAWGAELGPDETPWEVGLALSVKLDKPTDFIGKAALLASRGQPLRKKLVTVVVSTPEAYAWGGETLRLNGEPVGDITSIGWSPLVGACVGLGYLRGPAAMHAHNGTAAEMDLWGEAVGVRLFERWLEKG